MSDLYLETSALVRSILEKDRDLAAAIAKFDRVVTSRLTFMEADWALHRARLAGRITDTGAKEAAAGLQLLRQRSEIVAMGEDVAARASGEFPAEPVRTLDALHLATALAGREAFGLESTGCSQPTRPARSSDAPIRKRSRGRRSPLLLESVISAVQKY